MRIPRLWVGLAGAAGLLLVSHVASGAEQSDPVEAKIQIIENLSQPDHQRIATRTSLLNDLRVNPGPVAARILKLGKEATNDNVRMQVAILLVDQRRGNKPLFPAALNPEITRLLTTWLETEGNDAGLRYWAAIGLAQEQNLQVLELLKAKALGPDVSPIVRAAVARALAAWRGDLLVKHVVPILLDMLRDKDIEMRVAACDALLRTELNEEFVIEPLLAVARTDPKEPVWRAAATALYKIGGGRLQVKSNATDAERKGDIQKWEDVWRSKRRREEREK